ncbi:outer membrane beta-barrel protein [Mucilaginibacter achroorhodeus]|uniref:Outer membrane beta-barrel protein n=1 Tax=Mucilaginibacter achroorhodeus TaxID=2599294 RepID=A0A563U8X6_9SPHI|nr:outer membrane beta-barrel protein [Mucilaginibacter achroorhodeus]TWR27795.1 outer membrane beta-barrel protein [Mucilaginibacter achroorhodeus]
MKKFFTALTIALTCASINTMAQTASETKPEQKDSTKKKPEIPADAEPLNYADFSWINGQNRQKSKLLDNKYFTGDFTFDMNYTRSNHNPIDNTVTGSTALARNGEAEVSFVGIGGDFHYDNVRGRIMTQFGTRSTVVPRNDYSGYRGQYDLPDAYRYLSEAYGGYHFNSWHGINVDMGIFMSYIGMYSYNNFENWSYQPSYTSDNTPWFFNGIRVQAFPSVTTKVELWIINGWQSYGMFNKMPGIGFSVNTRPSPTFSFVSNNYFGTDVAGAPGVKRYHTDNSIQHLYFDAANKSTSGIKRAAFTLTADFGFQNGTAPGGVVYSAFGKNASNFISAMAYNRLWFGKDMKWGWTLGGGFMSNPSRYLALVPPGQATDSFLAASTPGSKMAGWDASSCIDYNPNQFLTVRFELVHRFMNVPYFNGHGGVTSPSGYQTNPATSFNPNSYIPADASFTPDLVKSENRFIIALMTRF